MIALRTFGRQIAALCAAFMCLATPDAEAQSRSVQPLRILVAYPPGGPSDETARLIAEQMAVRLGVPVLVENRAGAGGSVGIEALARSAPDGNTLGFAAISPLTLNPHLGRVNYDAGTDIVPVTSVMVSPVLLVATPAFAGGSLRDLLVTARTRPGQVRWATSGMATVGHLMLEQVRLAGQVDITHIPYKGGAQQLIDALGGQFEVVSANLTAALLAHVHAGRLRALALGAPSRMAVLPEVQTFIELGMAQANLSSTFGMFAPGRTPANRVLGLNAAIDEILRRPETRARIAAGGNLPTGGSSAEFARQIALESQSNLRLVRAAGIKAE